MGSPLLPLEVFLHIIRQFTCSKTLCALSLCCRNFRDDAQGILFYHPCVLSSYPPARHEAFIDAITSSPNRLARMVHIYTLGYFSTVSQELITAAVRAMSNVKQLGILAPWQINAEDIVHWTFQLDVLTWGDYGDILLSYPHVLSAILPTQPNLKHLRVYGDTVGRLQMDPRWCPNLQSVAGLASFVNMALCGARPIRQVQWINFPGCEFMEPAVDGMTPSQPPDALGLVQYFSFKLHANMPNQAFLRHMRSLILVDNYVVCASDSEMTNRLDFLTNVPGLQRLILTGNVLSHYPNERAEPYMISARRAFNLCSNLRYIDIRHDPSEYTFHRFFPPSTTSGHREMQVTTVAEDKVSRHRHTRVHPNGLRRLGLLLSKTNPDKRGILSTGYTGGNLKITKLSSEQVCSGRTDYTINLEFDPRVVSYAELVEFFCRSHHPTTKNRQGNDSETQHRSAIFTTTPDQAETARRVTEEVQAKHFSGKVPLRLLSTPHFPSMFLRLSFADRCDPTHVVARRLPLLRLVPS
ncbi:hypothetical protein D9619_007581 [Psilocybe cf. subviscida]|uniref:peptide-methionine (S)-S-oxide reductase n=1 Tax=Psilocybe cf. subviscida TaxID=2480587 RepID=A0A8H5B1Z7_9AGAR|nr:hypothetical protein D9619_007581 [Psilocybe cf. subviscida]